MDKKSWDERYAADGLVWTAQANRFLVAETQALTPGRALDLAAGEGRNAVWLAEQGWQVHAVDFSARGIEKGKALAHKRSVAVEWEVTDLLEFEPQPAAYQLVAILYLHLPWSAMRVVLERAAAAVAPGGTLLLVGHDRTNITDGHGGPQDPAILYQPQEVAQALPGLRIDRAEQVQRPVSTDAGERIAIDCLVRARRA